MIFRRRKDREEALEETSGAEEPTGTEEPEETGADDAEDPGDASADPADAIDLAELDSRDWRGAGPYDVSEVDLDDEPPPGVPRIDLGSIIVTGFPGAELRLQVDEGTQTIVSAMLVHGDSALEIGAYAAPRSGGYWSELRADLIEATTEAGGSTALVEGPFGVELRRIIPVSAPSGEEGYQPSRMWVVEGPRWLLRGIVYGQAALEEGVEPPVAQFLTAFRSVVVRRGDQPMGPGDLLTLTLPPDLVPGGVDGAG
jgi:hypothetical protein